MSRVFDLLLAEKVITSAAVPAFERYLSDRTFQGIAESRLLMQDRVSLATLAGPPPEAMGQGALFSVLYDMRHRFRSALEHLRELDFKTPLKNSLYHSTARERL